MRALGIATNVEQLTWKRDVGMMGSFRVPVNSCQASTMFSGGPLATDTQCPSDSSCRWNLHLQHIKLLA